MRVVEVGLDTRIADVLLGSGAATDAALHHEAGTLTYAALAERVRRQASAFELAPRSLVVLAGARSVDWVIAYLALLDAGHVPLLAGARRCAIEAAWSPAATVLVGAPTEARGAVGDAPRIEVRRHDPAPAPELHPDLALLLSTSGSTGSPRLVRLSHRNLASNALAIAESLGLRSDDVGLTSLPLHYCYGLSVLHSHLAVGASVAVSERSVVDPGFSSTLASHGVTSLAGVPYTFDLLEAADPDVVGVPSLRRLTVAGGSMVPEARSRWRRRAERWGTDLVIMYGQTEATARMAVLPPALAAMGGPRAVGRPIPGGRMWVDAPDGDRGGIGELVYAGPNVMLGYATERGDLARGAELAELRTGDLGRVDPETGIVEVLGRCRRIAKPLGLRIDLDRLEADLWGRVGPVSVAGDDDLVVVAAPGHTAGPLRDLVAGRAGLPVGAVEVLDIDPPRTESGKVDEPAFVAMAHRQRQDLQEAQADAVLDVPVSSLLAEVLGRPSLSPEDTFASAGGDSLSYVEASMRVEARLGELPADWQHLPMAQLDALRPGRSARRLDATVLLRAIGICAVVSTHMRLLWFPGGAHLLLVVTGYNLSRFQLGIASTAARVRAGLRTVGRVAVPTVACAAAVVVLTDRYGWTTVALVNNYAGPRGHQDGHWHFWFVEAFVQITAIVMAVLAIPPVRRLERRAPYGFALGVLAVALVARELPFGALDDPLNLRFRTHGVAWFVALGWLAHRSKTPTQRLLTTALCVAVVPGFFGLPQREWFIVAGVVLLLWVPRVRMPGVAAQPVAALATASMWILISHFHVWPVLERELPLPAAYAATLGVGVAIALLAQRVPREARLAVTRLRAHRSPRRTETPSPASVPPASLVD